jgi:hypothetical protein
MPGRPREATPAIARMQPQFLRNVAQVGVPPAFLRLIHMPVDKFVDEYFRASQGARQDAFPGPPGRPRKNSAKRSYSMGCDQHADSLPIRLAERHGLQATVHNPIDRSHPRPRQSGKVKASTSICGKKKHVSVSATSSTSTHQQPLSHWLQTIPRDYPHGLWISLWMTLWTRPGRRANTASPAPWRVSRQLHQVQLKQHVGRTARAPLDNPETNQTRPAYLCKTCCATQQDEHPGAPERAAVNRSRPPAFNDS